MTRQLSARHGVYAGVAIGFMLDPTLVRNVVLIGGAAALVVSLCWIWATGRSL
jgi:phage shock protein PspC (stress-responsive transcriptional regulator)